MRLWSVFILINLNLVLINLESSWVFMFVKIFWFVYGLSVMCYNLI